MQVRMRQLRSRLHAVMVRPMERLSLLHHLGYHRPWSSSKHWKRRKWVVFVFAKSSFTTYNTILEVVKDIVCHFDSVEFLVVELRVSIFTSNNWDLVNIVGLVLEGVSDEDISAEISWQIWASFNLDVKVDRLPKEFLRLHDFCFFSRWTRSNRVTWVVTHLELTNLLVLVHCWENIGGFIHLYRVGQVLQWQALLSNKDCFCRIPVGVLMLVWEVWNYFSVVVFLHVLIHHIDTILELVVVPQVEVSLCTIVNPDQANTFRWIVGEVI